LERKKEAHRASRSSVCRGSISLSVYLRGLGRDVEVRRGSMNLSVYLRGLGGVERCRFVGEASTSVSILGVRDSRVCRCQNWKLTGLRGMVRDIDKHDSEGR